MPKFVVMLDSDERDLLRRITALGRPAARKRLKPKFFCSPMPPDGPARADDDIAERLGSRLSTIHRVVSDVSN